MNLYKATSFIYLILLFSCSFAQTNTMNSCACIKDTSECTIKNIYSGIYGTKEVPNSVFKSYLFLINNKACIINSIGEGEYYTLLANYSTFNSEYKTAVQYIDQTGYSDTITGSIDKKYETQFSFAPFFSQIKKICKDKQVVMINEAHHYPRTRMITEVLLDSLYQEGFSALALEALPNNPKLIEHWNFSKNVYYPTFSYVNEPVYNNLIRHAFKLGFTLIAYEDTMAFRENGLTRDSFQAVNLYNAMKNLHFPKTIVLAGFGHICKGNIDEDKMMARHVIDEYGLNVLTIDQTSFINRASTVFERKGYKYFKHQIKGIEPFMFKYNEIAPDPDCYDIQLFIPEDTYLWGRPTWLATNGLRTKVKVKLASNSQKKAAIVKAFVADHTSSIPIDQTIVYENTKKTNLYLPKGNYWISFQDCHEREIKGKALLVR